MHTLYFRCQTHLHGRLARIDDRAYPTDAPVPELDDSIL